MGAPTSGEEAAVAATSKTTACNQCGRLRPSETAVLYMGLCAQCYAKPAKYEHETLTPDSNHFQNTVKSNLGTIARLAELVERQTRRAVAERTEECAKLVETEGYDLSTLAAKIRGLIKK